MRVVGVVEAGDGGCVGVWGGFTCGTVQAAVCRRGGQRGWCRRVEVGGRSEWLTCLRNVCGAHVWSSSVADVYNRRV